VVVVVVGGNPKTVNRMSHKFPLFTLKTKPKYDPNKTKPTSAVGNKS